MGEAAAVHLTNSSVCETHRLAWFLSFVHNFGFGLKGCIQHLLDTKNAEDLTTT